MFVGFGTLLNIVAILGGSLFGILAGARLNLRTRTLMTDVLGCVTLIGAAGATSALWSQELTGSVSQGVPILIVLSSLLVGGLMGSLARIEDRLENLGIRLKNRFDSEGQSPFVEGFVTASLIFVIGPLAILGSISDGCRLELISWSSRAPWTSSHQSLLPPPLVGE